MKSGDILNVFTVHSFVVFRKWSPHSTVVDCLRQLQVRSFERLDPAAAILAYPRADVLPERKWSSFDGL